MERPELSTRPASNDSLTDGIKQYWTFFRLYFRARKLIGSVIPSSPALSGAVLDAAGVDHAKTIVEYGAGTGPMTSPILKRMRPDARLLAFELLPEFVQILHHRFDDPRMEIIARSAEALEEELDQRGIDRVDSIVCALPFNAMPPEVSRNILETARRRLADDGVLALVQQTRFQLKLIRSIFPDVRIHRYVMLNIPPTYVVACRPHAAGHVNGANTNGHAKVHANGHAVPETAARK
jgi:phospholipid N-methyltransferase